MAASAERIRGGTGPAVQRFGFRPFFLLAAFSAGLASVFWLDHVFDDIPASMADDCDKILFGTIAGASFPSPCSTGHS